MRLKKLFVIGILIAVSGLAITLIERISFSTGNITAGNAAVSDSVGFLAIIIGSIMLFYVSKKTRKRTKITEVDMDRTTRKDLENF